ncbi:molecular chaperone [Sphingomonas koreensis]|nr:molecular chaperone [Sphingomonas koreensis]
MVRFLRSLWLRIGVAVGIIAFSASATAYEVGPMRVTLVPSAGNITGTIHVNNDRDVPLPIELKTFRRIVRDDGSQSFDPVDGQFVIFPPQVQVAASSSQSIRFQYVGDPVVTESQAYVIQVTEVPVTPPGFSGVHFTYNFGVAVYIDPAHASDDLTVEGVKREDGSLLMTVRNDGNGYATLSRKSLTLASGVSKVTYEPTDLGTKLENPLVPPHFTRTVELKNTTIAGSADISAEFHDIKG